MTNFQSQHPARCKAIDLGNIVAAKGIIPSLRAATKKQCLQELATLASEQTGISQRAILETLLQRERLGSTGLGCGIAVPHVKFKELNRIVCIFARLEAPIDFEALDGEPVDLIFLLLAPEHASGNHLKALSRISRLLREPDVSNQLRTIKDAQKLLEILCQPVAAQAA